MTSELLFYIGISICVISAACAVITVVIRHFAWKRLNQQLNEEYGKRRH